MIYCGKLDVVFVVPLKKEWTCNSTLLYVASVLGVSGEKLSSTFFLWICNYLIWCALLYYNTTIHKDCLLYTSVPYWTFDSACNNGSELEVALHRPGGYIIRYVVRQGERRS